MRRKPGFNGRACFACVTPKAQFSNHAERTYWFIDISNCAIGGIVVGGESGYPDEVGQFVEGAVKRVVVNAYERDPEARASCLSRTRVTHHSPLTR